LNLCLISLLGEDERKAEWLGKVKRKPTKKVKTTGQMLPFKNGTALPSPSQAACWAKSFS